MGQDHTSDTEGDIAGLRAEVAALRDELRELRSSVQDAPAAAVPPADGGGNVDASGTRTVPAAPGDALPAGPTGRRAVLARAGLVAGVVAGTVATSRPAAAATGSNLVLGSANDASTTTTAAYTGPSNAHGFSFSDAVATPSTAQGLATLHATSTALGHGVLGTTSTPTGRGVGGVGSGTDGTGVLGAGPGASGTGVAGIGGLIGVDARTGEGSGTVSVRASHAERGIVVSDATVFALSVRPRSTGGTGPAPGAALTGDWYFDEAGEVWYCVAAGTPGTFRRLTGTSTAGAFVATDPRRVHDSRLAGGPLAHGQSSVVSVANAINPWTGTVTVPDFVPPGATAIAYNLTVTNTVGSGYVQIAPGDAGGVTASSINWTASGQTIANGLVVRLDAARRIKLFEAGPGSSTDVIVDVVGYYR
jgi:hypothetical protein